MQILGKIELFSHTFPPIPIYHDPPPPIYDFQKFSNPYHLLGREGNALSSSVQIILFSIFRSVVCPVDFIL